MGSFVLRPATGVPVASAGGLALWAQVCEIAGRWLLAVAASHAAARKARRTLVELQRLDSRMLQDIGLTRADVDMFAGSLPGAARRDADWERLS